jgi:hypothetical protein
MDVIRSPGSKLWVEMFRRSLALAAATSRRDRLPGDPGKGHFFREA